MNDISDWVGFIVWPEGDMGRHTCRVYKTLGEALDAAQSSADFYHRPYEIRTAYKSPARVLETVKPRRRK